MSGTVLSLAGIGASLIATCQWPKELKIDRHHHEEAPLTNMRGPSIPAFLLVTGHLDHKQEFFTEAKQGHWLTYPGVNSEL